MLSIIYVKIKKKIKCNRLLFCQHSKCWQICKILLNLIIISHCEVHHLSHERCHRITAIQRNLAENLSSVTINTVAANGIAPLGARSFAGTAVIDFGSSIYGASIWNFDYSMWVFPLFTVFTLCFFTPQPSGLEGYCRHGPGGRAAGRAAAKLAEPISL